MPLLPALLDLVYPRTCHGCGRPAGDVLRYICWECLTRLQLVVDPFCSVCGDPVEGEVDHVFACAWCEGHRPAFDQARSALRFRGSLPHVVHAFKYQRGCYLVPDLVGFLDACVRTHYARVSFDAVTYVPLYPLRERERTYNQSCLLAEGLGARLGIPLGRGCLERVRPTETQTGLSAADRRRNVRHAFRVRHTDWVDGRRLLLVDDVMTTGSTVDEVSRVLRDAGAASVHVVTVARG